MKPYRRDQICKTWTQEDWNFAYLDTSNAHRQEWNQDYPEGDADFMTMYLLVEQAKSKGSSYEAEVIDWNSQKH